MLVMRSQARGWRILAACLLVCALRLSRSFAFTLVRTATPRTPTVVLPRTQQWRSRLRATQMLPANQKLQVHPNLVSGRLTNGLRFHILPNKVPGKWIETHLEVLSGSAHELEHQQGMAHLLEHVAFMGNSGRQRLAGTGAKTNAYTDFHHTVFFTSAPTHISEYARSVHSLPLSLDAMVEVLQTKVGERRLEMERAAVLSETAVVNKLDYRVEGQILTTLHRENRISRRFPIGKEELIRRWTPHDLQTYHAMHFRPDNAVLYVVGDVEAGSAEELIRAKFGALQRDEEALKALIDAGEYPKHSVQQLSPHFPPLVHDWSASAEMVRKHVPEELIRAKDDYVARLNAQDGIHTDVSTLLPKPSVMQHNLLQSFSFHIFAKRPLVRVQDFAAFRQELMNRLCLAAMQVRFNVMQRQHPVCTFVEFNNLNWAREGCTVCSLDLTTDWEQWKEAVKLAVTELKRLGLYGLSQSELLRYKGALQAESAQFAAQANHMESEKVLQDLMESVATERTFMHPVDSQVVTERALESISVEDVCRAAQELCEHISHPSVERRVRPAAIVACAPTKNHAEEDVVLTAKDIEAIIEDAVRTPVQPLPEVQIPTSLLSEQEMAALQKNAPTFVEAPASGASKEKLVDDPLTGIHQRRLPNGIAVNLKTSGDEPGKGSLQLFVPGGRLLERADEPPGAMLAGAKTMQEGGAVGNFTREQVELFAVDNMLLVDVQSHHDMFTIDLSFPTASTVRSGVSGIEAAFQTLHAILTNFKWEEAAFKRAQQQLHELHETYTKDLEASSTELIMNALFANDTRFVTPTHKDISGLTFEQARDAITRLLGTDRIEVSVSADVPLEQLEQLALKYLGSVPTQKLGEPDPLKEPKMPLVHAPVTKPIVHYLPDSEERVMGYLAGYAPNRWGVDTNGSSVGLEINSLLSSSSSADDIVRRTHPLFGSVALQLLQEVASRKLFTVVREEEHLTYDANFQMFSFTRSKVGWYLVSVITSPHEATKALAACQKVLHALARPGGVSLAAVQSAASTLLSRHQEDIRSNRFWVDTLSGTQSPSIPWKTADRLTEFEAVLASVSPEDLRALAEVMGFHRPAPVSCISVAAPSLPDRLLSQ